MDYKLLKEMLSLLAEFESDKSSASKDSTAFIHWLLKDQMLTADDLNKDEVPSDDLKIVDSELFVAMVFRLTNALELLNLSRFWRSVPAHFSIKNNLPLASTTGKASYEWTCIEEQHRTADITHFLEKGWLVQKERKINQRTFHVRLSEHGEKALTDWLEDAVSRNSYLSAALTQDDENNLLKLLKKLTDNSPR